MESSEFPAADQADRGVQPLTLRLYDPDRRPPNWTDIIRPGQYVVFSKTVDGGGPCDPDGLPFPSPEAATCLVFDRLAAARQYCDAQVQRASAVRFEVFGAAGRTEPPLLVVVHPSRAGSIEGSARGIRTRRQAAWVLVVASLILFWYDFQHDRGMLVFPTLLGINLLVVAARFLQLNAAYRHSARARAQRLDEHLRADEEACAQRKALL